MRRIFDLILLLTLLPIVIIVIAICAVSIILESGGPVLYKSERVGRQGSSFVIFKLRTMVLEAPCVPTANSSVAGYVTRVGRILRLFSLDELPQFFNILNGSMTFIGPRPCLSSEVELIKRREYENIFALTPGLTGLAQVRGRDKNSVRNKVRYESFYLKKKSFLLDLTIIVMTIRTVFNCSGVNH